MTSSTSTPHPDLSERPFHKRNAVLDLVRRQPLGAAGLLIVTGMVLVALLAPWLAPYGPKYVGFAIYQPPGPAHLMGTDHLGRDVASRVIWGARLSLYVGLLSVSISVTFGSLWGMATGFYGGNVDVLSQRVVDVLMGFPGIVLALALMSVLGPSVNNVITALSFLLVPTAARTMRSSVLGLKEVTYIEAAKALGCSNWRIILVHLAPNVLGTYIVLFTVNVAYAIVVEASLSFLGLGVPPDEPSWGGMITGAIQSLERAPWVAVFPGAAICLVVFGLNLLGDALRDVADVKLRGTGED